MIPLGACQCGCGRRTNLAKQTKTDAGWIKGQPLLYALGHAPKRRGRDHHKYNGGLFLREDGRAIIVCRDRSLLYFYRGVMAAHVGRLLTSEEVVHHKNEDRTDDRIENLQIVTHAEHIEIHREAMVAGRYGPRGGAS